MSRTRLTLVALLAVLVVGVVASASATEPPKKCGGKVTATPAYCVEGLQLENAKGEPIADKIEGTASVSVLKATIAMVTSEVECKKGQSKGTIKGGAAGTAGKSKIIETFEECKLLQPANCKLSPEDEKEIITAELVGTLELASGKIEDRFAPEGGFADIGIEGKESSCVIAEIGRPKTFEVIGSQVCSVDKASLEAETEAPTHQLACKVSGGSLKIGTNGAEMTSEAAIKLTTGKKWSIREST